MVGGKYDQAAVKLLSREYSCAARATGSLWLVIGVRGVRGREDTSAGGSSLPEALPSLHSSALRFHFSTIFLPHNASKVLSLPP